MKKIISILLSVIMIIGISVTIPVQAADKSDISDLGANLDIVETGNPYNRYAVDINGNWANCTYWAWQYAYDAGYHLPDYSWGNGGSWYARAQKEGYYCDRTPSVNSIMCTGSGTYGHVAFVTDYNSATGKVYIKQGGVGGTYDGRSEWWTSAYPSDLQGYIHLDGGKPPTNAWFSASRKALPIGMEITFNFGADNATNYFIGIDRNGERIITEAVTSGQSYYFNETGTYSAYVTAYNSTGGIDSNKVEFTVYQARNVGNTFTAAILNTATGVAVTVDDSENVVVKQYKGTTDQLWKFERGATVKSYKITNVKTGKCLDVLNGSGDENTNIQVWKDNGATAQRWYLRSNGTGYSIVPSCASHGGIDMVGGVSNDGNNIALWTCVEKNTNQIFTLQMVDTPAYTASFNGHKYELYNSSLCWKEAVQFCEQQGGHLVTITSQEEQDFINSMLPKVTNDRTWAGGTDSYKEGNWMWITGEKFDYKNWSSGEPNNSDNNENYLMLSKSGKWNDVDDIFNNTGFSYSLICEYDDVIDTSRVTLEKAFNYNNHRYEIYSGTLDWLSAKLLCEQKGGHLITITSSDEQNVIANQVKELNHKSYWLGLTDVEIESKWHWITDEDYSYKNWNSGEPNNSEANEDYAVFVPTTGKWNDLAGLTCLNTDIGIICEYDSLPLLGDVDGDGTVSITDTTFIQRDIAKIDIPFVMNNAVADIDGNGEVAITDATFIQRWLVDMKSNDNIGKPLK